MADRVRDTASADVREMTTLAPPLAPQGRNRRRILYGAPWVALLSFFMILFLLVPLGGLVFRSAFGGQVGQFLGDPAVNDALRLSFITTGVTLLLAVTFGTPVAWLLARHTFRGRTLLDTLIDLPMVLPPAVAGVALLITLGRRGFVGQWLDDSFGIAIGFTTVAVILAQTFIAAPFYIKAARAGFESVDPTFEVVATTLGYSRARAFVWITVPLAAPALLSGLVMAWARALGEFGATIMFAGSFMGKTRTMPLAIYAALEGDGGIDEALALSLILVVVSFAVLLLVKFLVRARDQNGAAIDGALALAATPAPAMSAENGTGGDLSDLPDLSAVLARPIPIAYATDTGPLLDVAIRLRLPGFDLDSRVHLTGGPERVLVLFGPSGSGKSLTLKAIVGVLRPESGHITIRSRTLFDAAHAIDLPPQARRVGYVPQNYALFPHLTVRENIGAGLFGLPAAERTERVTQLVRLLGLDGLDTRRPGQLSGGQQQRVALARAMAIRPDLLLLDEPFTALDAPIRRRLRQEMRDLSRALHLPMVVVTHDLDEAYTLADRIAVFDRGAIVQSGPPDNILAHPATLTVAHLIGTRNLLPGIVRTDGPQANVDCGGLRFLAQTALAAGTAVTLCIRPENIGVLHSGATMPDSWRGVIIPARLVADTPQPDQHLLRFQVITPNAAPATIEATLNRRDYATLALMPGQTLHLAIPADAVHLIPATAP